MAEPTRIRTTHVGSLPRTPAVNAINLERMAGATVDEAAYERVVSEAVAEVVRHQVDAGISMVNDGEQSKPSFFNYHFGRLSGFELHERPEGAKLPVGALGFEGERLDHPDFFEGFSRIAGVQAQAPDPSDPPPQDLCCVAPVAWSDFSQVERDIANLKTAADAAGAESVFMTAISPGTYAPLNLYYASEEEYLFALGDALSREYAAILDAGFSLQIDAPDLTTEYRLRRITMDEHLEHMDLCIAAINHATRDLPPERVRVHVCWGADEAPHHRDIPLQDIVDRLLGMRPAGLSIPGANGRHAHEWKVWRDVKLPDDKFLVPGVIDSTTNIIEHPDAVAQRIADYASVVGPDRVLASIDCGYAYNQVATSVIWAKMRSLAQGAELASARI